MPHLRAILLAAFCSLIVADQGLAEEKSFYSPVILVDKEKNQILISTSAKVFYIEISDAAKPHIDKLPQGVLVDFVVEMRGDQPPLLKKWNVKGGDSACQVFDGKGCK